MADFHAAFHVFCEDQFPADLLYPQCCHEFHLLTKDSDVHEKYVVEENVLHHDQEDPISPFENLKNDDQIDKLESGTVEIEEDHEGSLQVQGLQRLEICSRREEEQKELDQQYIMHVSLIEDEQFAVDMEIGGSHQQQHVNLQLEQLLKEVFLDVFNDPIDDYLQSMNNICVKVFLSDEIWLYHLFKPLFYWLYIPLFFGSRPRTGLVN